jgi:hypothetical protein
MLNIKSAIKTYHGAGPSIFGQEQLHIYKDPPAAKFTRKYEPVNIGDVNYMIRPDSEQGDITRINEAINTYARGKNPMVEVDYGAGQGVKNPYRIEVVRPPEFPIETLVPLSAPRIHQNYSMSTNPNIAPITVAEDYDKYKVRNIVSNDPAAGVIRINPSYSKLEIVEKLMPGLPNYWHETLQGSVRPTASYNLDLMRENTNLRSTATTDLKPKVGLSSNITFTEVTVFDPKTNSSLYVQSNIRERNNIAMQAALGMPITLNTNDGKQIRLKDYEYKVVQSSVGNSQMVIQVNQPEIVLERNTPLFAVQATMGTSSLLSDTLKPTAELQLDRNTPLFSQLANISSTMNPMMQQNAKFDLQRNTPMFSQQAKVSSRMNPTMQQNAQFDLQRNTPMFSQQANVSTKADIQRMGELGELERNTPMYSQQANVSTKADIQRMGELGELERNTPMYSQQANVSQRDTRMMLNQEHNLERNVGSTQGMTNWSNLKSGIMNKNADYQLERTMPQYSAVAQKAQSVGYNEDLRRESKVKELTKIANFGEYTDRVTRIPSERNTEHQYSSMLKRDNYRASANRELMA